MKHYLRIEAVNLANFIYDTTDLSTIRGGGLLLLNAIDEIKKHFKFESISTGASSGLFSFSTDEKPDKVRDAVFKYINEHPQFKHATFVVDVLEKGKDFKEVLEKLIALNRWRQMQSPTVIFPDNKQQNLEHPVCGIDHVRPSSAIRKIQKGNNDPIFVSESVYQRHEYGLDQKKKEFYRRQAHLDSPFEFTNDLTELTDDENQGNLHNKMAVIYLDGNSFGKLQRGLDEESLQEFDNRIKTYRSQFLKDLLLEITKSSEFSKWYYSSDKKIRLETLLWGGDELMLVVPAWKGWWTLQFFFEKSKEWKFNKQRLTHAAGLVFCHHKAPIHRITKLAHDLGDLAKDKKDDKGNKIGREANYVAYQVLESFDHTGLEIETFREKSLDSSDLNSNDLIVEGDKMGQLEDIIAKTVLAKGRVYKIIDAILNNKSDKQNLIKKAKEQIKTQLEEKDLAKLSTLDEDSFWLHLIELWDYIEEGES